MLRSVVTHSQNENKNHIDLNRATKSRALVLAKKGLREDSGPEKYLYLILNPGKVDVDNYF